MFLDSIPDRLSNVVRQHTARQENIHRLEFFLIKKKLSLFPDDMIVSIEGINQNFLEVINNCNRVLSI